MTPRRQSTPPRIHPTPAPSHIFPHPNPSQSLAGVFFLFSSGQPFALVLSQVPLLVGVYGLYATVRCQMPAHARARLCPIGPAPPAAAVCVCAHSRRPPATDRTP